MKRTMLSLMLAVTALSGFATDAPVRRPWDDDECLVHRWDRTVYRPDCTVYRPYPPRPIDCRRSCGF